MHSPAKYLHIIFAIFFSANLFSQNLVPNPSFECYSACPDNYDQLARAKNWTPLPSAGPDSYNKCSSTYGIGFPILGVTGNVPNTGDGCAGLRMYYNSSPNSREYIQAKLIQPLQQGKCYSVSFYVKLCSYLNTAVDRIGAHFSNSAIALTGGNLFGYVPQVSNPTGFPVTSTGAWVQISGTFIAAGGEQYITIGDFYPAAQNTIYMAGMGYSHYFIDDVCVKECGESCTPTIKNSNPVICNGSSSTLSTTCNNALYSWSNGATTNMITVTPNINTNYSVIINDTLACQTFTDVATVTVNPIPQLNPTKTDITCFGNNNGTISPNASGGTGNYTFTWSNGQTSPTLNNLPQGIYTATVSDGLCSATLTTTITEPSLLIGLLPSQNDVSCFNGSNGGITGAAIGGTSPYSYNWSNGGASSSVTNIPAGIYSVTITDANGCTAIKSTTIIQPTILNASISTTTLSCFGSANATMSANVNGGVPNYNYTWLPGGNNNQSVSNVSAGTYSLTVQDNNGCTTVVSVSIANPSAVAVTINKTDVLCNGTATGIANAGGNGGTGAYNYVWSNAQGSAQATGLAAGIYSVTVTDGNGCTGTANTTISEPSAITTTTSSVDAHCNQADGSASVVANGGTPGYNYKWSNGINTASNNNITQGVYSVTITDANGCSTLNTINIHNLNGVNAQANVVNNTSCNNSCDGSALAIAVGGNGPYIYNWSNAQNIANASGLCAGSYSVTITDNNGCTSQATVAITQPAAIVSNINAVNVSCFGLTDGSATITPTGGLNPFTYTWNNAQNNNTANNLSAGIYSCTVNDANGCSIIVNNITIIEPTQINVNILNAPTICAGAATILNANANGGTPGYNYLWSNNVASNVINVTVNVQTVYTLTVTDNSGCTAVSSTTVDVYQLPVVTFNTDHVSGCGPLCVNFTNTTANTNSLNWYFGESGATSTQSPANHCYNNPGSYNVILYVTDNNGCTDSLTQINYITVYPNPVADFSSAPQPTTILNPTVYFTDLSVGATNWQWSFGDITNAGSTIQNPNFNYSDTGSYVVNLEVTNEFGCPASISHIVKIDPDYIVYIPNTFTPNGDGINDLFIPIGMGFDSEKYELLIYDRWGNLIFKSTNPNAGWDGTIDGTEAIQQDVYVWKLVVRNIIDDRISRLVGSINVIR